MIDVNPKELYEFLVSMDIKYFFHANTVTTSCTYIEHKGLMSWGCIVSKGLIQTDQSSDDIDKKFDVWNDIFIDIIDLHGYFPRQNLYGPVCFVMDNKLLLDKNLPNICITKDNPIYWNELMSDIDKYYCSVQEYEDEFDNNMRKKSIHSKMFTIHNTHKKIPFSKYLTKIILDNPEVKINDVNLYKRAKQKLVSTLEKTGFDNCILETRSCTNCYCHDNYLKQVEIDELKKLFL